MCAVRDSNPGPAKEIARALRVPPAKIAPLVRLIAAQNAELQRRPDVVECWVSPGWHEGLTFEPHPDWPVNPSTPDGHGGLVTVIVARPDQRSRSRVCVYLVDTFCRVSDVVGRGFPTLPSVGAVVFCARWGR